MPDRRWELKLADGRVVEWDGVDGETAARRYVDTHRTATVVASRPADRHGLFVLGRHARFTETAEDYAAERRAARLRGDD